MTKLAATLGVLLVSFGMAGCDKADEKAEPEAPRLTAEEQAAKDVVALAKATGDYYTRTGKCIDAIPMTPPAAESCRGGCGPETWAGGAWAELGWKPDGDRSTHFSVEIESADVDEHGVPYCMAIAVASLDADGDKRFREFSSAAAMDNNGVSVHGELEIDGAD